MPKWKAQDRTVCIRGTVVCGQAEDDAECGIIVDAHNAEIRTITAERDRLAAEISATNAAYATLLESHELILDALTESDATLDRLREVVPKWDSCNAWGCSTAKVKAILYPENET